MWRWDIGVVVLGLAGVCGCEDYNHWTDAPREPPVTDGTAITGTMDVTYWAGGEAIEEVVDLSGIRIEAFAPRQDGSLRRFSGSGTEDGEFFTAQVPDGIAYFHFGYGPWYASEDRQFDFGIEYAGRPDAGYAFPGPELHVTADGLAPWQDTDEIRIVCPNLGLYMPPFDAPDPAVGTTSLSDWVVPWDFYPLVKANEGDRVMLVQRSSRAFGADMARVARRVLSPHEFSLFEGQATSVGGTFVPIETTGRADFQIDVPAFAALRSTDNAVAVRDEAVFVEAFSQVPGASVAYGQAVLFDVWLTNGGAPVSLSDLVYGNPYPAEWAELVNVWVPSYRELSAPGIPPLSMYFETTMTVPIADVVGDTLEPMLSAPRNLRVNGLDATEHQVGVGVVPELSWDPPAIGTPQVYQVTLWEWFVDGDDVRIADIRDFETPETRLAFHKLALRNGRIYTFAIAAIAMPGSNRAIAPYRRSVPYARAEAVTHVLVP